MGRSRYEQMVRMKNLEVLMPLSDDTMKSLRQAHADLGREHDHTELYEDMGRVLREEDKNSDRKRKIATLERLKTDIEAGVHDGYTFPDALRRAAESWEPF
jgi:hypothetical protein